MEWKLKMEKIDNWMKGSFRNNGITILKIIHSSFYKNK